MSVKDELGKRMKEYYESISDTKLTRRMPVAIRIDGKAFHTFTKGFVKPFDEVLVRAMQETMKYLCENIQGCVLGYTQSDEITLILVDYQNLDSSAWFDYRVQKMCSVTASMATMAFNKAFDEAFDEWVCKNLSDCDNNGTWGFVDENLMELYEVYSNAQEKGAMFDARVFNIPKEEVTNLIFWRQLDATRNSIQMVGQANFSCKELQYKSLNMIQDMLMTKKGINWNDFPTHLKRGSCCIKEEYYLDSLDESLPRNHWVIDNEIPIFKSEDRQYIEKLINFKEE